MEAQQMTFDTVLPSPKANPCANCAYNENEKCTYPDTRWDYCFGKDKYKPKREGEEFSENGKNQQL